MRDLRAGQGTPDMIGDFDESLCCSPSMARLARVLDLAGCGEQGEPDRWRYTGSFRDRRGSLRSPHPTWAGTAIWTLLFIRAPTVKVRIEPRGTVRADTMAEISF